MKLSKTELRYYLTNFRTRKSYLMFQLVQLILAICVICLALSNPQHFRASLVLYLEFLLILCMTFDLLVVRWISEGSLWTTKENKFDFVLLFVFMLTFVFLCFTEKQIRRKGSNQNNYEEVLLETDDIIIIVFVMIRYTLQIYRMIITICNTRRNISLQKKIKQIDLNINGSAIEEHNDAKQDEIMRNKIAERFDSERVGSMQVQMKEEEN